MDFRIDVGIDRGLGEGRFSCWTSAIMYRLRIRWGETGVQGMGLDSLLLYCVE